MWPVKPVLDDNVSKESSHRNKRLVDLSEMAEVFDTSSKADLSEMAEVFVTSSKADLSEMAEVFVTSSKGNLEQRCTTKGKLSNCTPLNYVNMFLMCSYIIHKYVCCLLENYFQQIDKLDAFEK